MGSVFWLWGTLVVMCLVGASMSLATEEDFVCAMTQYDIPCEDCHNFCEGCGITCDSDGHIIKIQWNNNNIEHIETSIGQLTHLRELNLNFNKVTHIPDQISSLKTLTVLILASNEVTVLPSSIFQLTALEELDLTNNIIKVLPDQIASLNKLRVLSLKDNVLSYLPDQLCDITTLTHLHMDSNRLNDLPACTSRLTALKLLTLDKNFLETLPLLEPLVALKELSVVSNALKEFPASVCNLPALTKLGLSLNRLTQVPSCDSPVETLSLAKNQFVGFPEGLTRWSKIKSLDVAHHHFTTLAPLTAASFPDLHDIDVSFNCLDCEQVEELFGAVPAVTCAPPTQHMCSNSSSDSSEEGSSTQPVPPASSSTKPAPEPGWALWKTVLIVLGALAAVGLVAVLFFVLRRKRPTQSGYEPINSNTI